MARTASTPARKSTPRKSGAAAGAAQHANQQAMQTQTAPVATPAPSPAQDLQQRANAIVAEGNTGNGGNGPKTDDANLVMPHIQHSVLVTSMKGAVAGFKAAINLEIAIACAVFVEAGDSGTKAKKELYSVYGEAGFDCKVGGEGKDYKTVNRRIGYAAQFFDSLPKDSLKTIMGEARDEAALQVLVAHIATKYNFRDMSDVQEAAGIAPAVRQPRNGGSQDGGGNASGGNAPQGGSGGGGAAQGTGQSVFQTSATATPTGVPQPDAGDQGVMGAVAQAGAQREAAQQNRREFDDQSKWVRHTYEGATILLPVDFKVACLHELGIKLVQAAAHMRGDRMDVATLAAEFKEAVAAH
jgi:hypothetical protein